MQNGNANISTSNYASIMVAVDLGPAAVDRVKLAGRLADRFSSHLIGVAAKAIPTPMYFETGVGTGPSIMELAEKRANEEFAQAEKLFRDAVAMRNSIEWRQAARPGALFVCEQARAADLLIVGRRGPEDLPQGSLGVNPGDVVMQCGRPILVVPPNQSVSAERIVIAWKDTREARRAVADSMPFLKQAKMVFVTSIADDGEAAGATDVMAYLQRHGVACEPLVWAARAANEPADEILDIAGEEGADLVVCGAYGHSRMREWIFGGVTRALLETSPVACFMSH